MNNQLSDEERDMLVTALDHYHAYLVATRREDGRYKDLAERLQRKGPGKEAFSEQPAKRKRG